MALLFNDGFVFDAGFARMALFVSLVSTVMLAIYWRSLVRRKLWIPGRNYIQASTLKRYLFFLPGTVVMITGLLWLNLGMALPYFYTSLAGTAETRPDLVIRDRGSRRTGCRFKLQPRSIESFGFRYCISEETYAGLPENEMPATLYLRKSALGLIVESIDLKRPKVAPE